MSNAHTETTGLDNWIEVPFEGTIGLCRLVRTQGLENTESVAEQALQVIVDGGYEKSSIVSYNSESCTISVHVAVEGEITQEYYNLTKKIDKAVNHA